MRLWAWFSARAPSTTRLRMNCDMSHFSLSFGGKPACTMRRSGSPFGNAFVKKMPLPFAP